MKKIIVVIIIFVALVLIRNTMFTDKVVTTTEGHRVIIVDDLEDSQDLIDSVEKQLAIKLDPIPTETESSNEQEQEQAPEDNLVEYDTATTLGQIQSRQVIFEYIPRGTQLFEHLNQLNTRQDKLAFSAYYQLFTSITNEDGDIIAYTVDSIKPSMMREDSAFYMLEKAINNLNQNEEMGQWSIERTEYVRSALEANLANYSYSINQLDCKEYKCIGLLDLENSPEAIASLEKVKSSINSHNQVFWYHTHDQKQYFIQAHFFNI